MIGIVVVSHSRALGEAVAALAREMAGGNPPPMTVAAGLDETTFGTDATAVAAAIEEVAADGNDVLVLVDIGSSVLSAEMACELIDPDIAERVRISAAPLVEGIVPAVVSAASGASLEEVAGDAEEGLDAKRVHLGADAGLDTPPPLRSSDTRPASESVEVVIADPHGLHARPAAKLVALVRSYDADVTLADIDSGAGPVPATSLSKVATLNAGHNARLRATADGPQASEVLAAIRDLVARDFADSPHEVSPPLRSPEYFPGTPKHAPTADAARSVVEPRSDAPSAQGSGLDAALGPAYVLRNDVDLEAYQQGSPAEEQQRSDSAVVAVAGAIRQQQGSDTGSTSELSDILGAHLVLLGDDTMLDDVAGRITRGESASASWQAVLNELAAEFEGLSDAYQRARAQDVRAIERQVLQALVHGPDSLGHQDIPDGAVLIVDELDPATAAGLDGAGVAGVVTMRGGSTGHGVIVARSRGIPIYTDGGDAVTNVEDGTTIGFDVNTRKLVVAPDEGQRSELVELLARHRADADEASRRATESAVTRDGMRIRVGANITSASDAAAAAEQGAEGSGLVRTEILFGASPTRPSATIQAAAFVAIGRSLGSEPVTIRTWDVGGDKPLPFLPGPQETNPMLGVRGLRLMHQHSELFDTQLDAVCAAAEQTPVRVMFPMVTTRDEVDWALDRLAAARAKVPEVNLAVGIMVEVPAAAIQIADLAAGLDFVSIGTNDLTQYTLAADRGNAGVSELADGLDPAVLQLIRRVVDEVPDGVEVGVCGDLASRVEAVPLLVGLGAHDLSVVGPMVPRVKQAIRRTSRTTARELADRALQAGSAKAVRELLVAHRMPTGSLRHC
ncbi:multiphosphoryl transfer protein (MTP) [Flexivirga endophytica]|uniref:Phosphocarrier protein HPr n=1 Tax=Flexivirga endophytica TaxID=1849103 RepID=A0A916T4J3_9MICO|nr:phosphoenolpyruvate--protein phosphotransferase [Flexivirga endophytica]GGB29134.1 multiphosphoryl transfer protein (MTP) [Flexivirga endophytica]GHB50214.1 multiphosphoryl transfer protein (MTP) [Flexivirga endophytica]